MFWRPCLQHFYVQSPCNLLSRIAYPFQIYIHFPSREVVNQINMITWNTESLIMFQICLWQQDISAEALQLSQFTALSPIAICIKFYDFERPMNSSGHFVSLSLSTTFVKTIILSSDTPSQSSIMICCTIVGHIKHVILRQTVSLY
jgi:hypothetical protein